MAWVTPRTWASGELITASIMNSAIRDNFNALSTFLSDRDITSGRLVIGAGTSSVVDTGDATLNGDITVSGTGPHAIGGALNNYTRLNLDGAFTSGGASSRVTALRVQGTMTGVNGDTTATEGALFDTAITTQSNSETIGRCTQVSIGEPTITKGTDTVTTSATLFIAGAASEATSNFAIWVDEGDVQIDDDLTASGTVTAGASPSALDGVFLGKTTSNHLMSLESQRSDSNGCTINLRFDGAGNNNDQPARIHAYGKDDGGTMRNVGRIDFQQEDTSAASQDSSIKFSVQNNSGSGTNTTGYLSIAGVWTDASDEASKEYLGTLQEHIGGSVLDQLADLNTGVYTQKDLPPGKTGETHAGPTAQQWFALFSLGRDPALSEPGIGPKDLASVALAAVQELVERNNALEARVTALEASIGG